MTTTASHLAAALTGAILAMIAALAIDLALDQIRPQRRRTPGPSPAIPDDQLDLVRSMNHVLADRLTTATADLHNQTDILRRGIAATLHIDTAAADGILTEAARRGALFDAPPTIELVRLSGDTIRCSTTVLEGLVRPPSVLGVIDVDEVDVERFEVAS